MITQLLLDTPKMQQAYFPCQGPARLHASTRRCHVKWTFTFLDLGMTHTIRGRVKVQSRESFVIVNNRRVESLQDASDQAYKGVYQRYLRAMYSKLGIPHAP